MSRDTFGRSWDTSCMLRDTSCMSRDTFDVIMTHVATRKHENEVEWLGARKESPFPLPSRRQNCLFKSSQLAPGLRRKKF